MSLRTQATNVSCLLGMILLLVVLTPSSANLSSSLADLKDRLMKAKPSVFVASNVNELCLEMAEKDQGNESGDAEYAAYCKAVFDASLELRTLESFLMLQEEEELDDFEDLLLRADALVVMAESYKDMYESQHSLVDGVEDGTLSSGNQQLQQDPPSEFNQEFEMISDLQRQLWRVAPSYEGVDIFNIAQWRAQKEAELEMVTKESLVPMHDFKVQQAKVWCEYARYCETALKASETLKTLEAQLRHASVEPLDDTFDDGLAKAPVLVSQVEGHMLSYRDALGDLQVLVDDKFSLDENDVSSVEEGTTISSGSQRLQQDLPSQFSEEYQMIFGLQRKLWKAAPSFEGVDIPNIEQWRSEKEAELEMVTKEALAPAHDLQVQKAKVQYEYALYCETAFKTSEALKALEARLRRAAEEPLDESFDDGLSEAPALVSQVEGRMLSYRSALADLKTLIEEEFPHAENEGTSAEEHTISFDSQQLQQDLLSEFNEEYRMVVDLQRKLWKAEPNYEGFVLSRDAIVQWRTEQEDELKRVTHASSEPQHDFRVHQAKLQYEYALYCETAFKASEALKTLEAQLRSAPVEPVDESLANGLFEAVLVSQVEGRMLSYRDALGDLRILIEDKLSLAENDHACVKDCIVSFDNEKIQRDILSEHSEEYEMIVELQKKLWKTEPTYEGVILDMDAIVQWRAQKEAELESVTAESLAPQYDFRVHQAKIQYEYALYCETAFKASEALKASDAQLRRAAVEPLDESFDDGLVKASVLVGQVEACKLSYSSALRPLESPLAGLKLRLHKEFGFLIPTDHEDSVKERQNELKLARTAKSCPGHFQEASRKCAILQAAARLQFAIYNQKAWEAAQAIESLEADVQKGNVAVDSDIFQERVDEAEVLVGKFQAHKVQYADMEKRLAPKPIEKSSSFKRLKSRIFSR